MHSLSESTSIELMLWGVVLLVLLILATTVVWIVRSKTVGDSNPPPDMLANFRDLRERGDISDKEFRTITSVLGAKLRQDAKQDAPPVDPPKPNLRNSPQDRED